MNFDTSLFKPRSREGSGVVANPPERSRPCGGAFQGGGGEPGRGRAAKLPFPPVECWTKKECGGGESTSGVLHGKITDRVDGWP